jgi:hypothetical protein
MWGFGPTTGIVSIAFDSPVVHSLPLPRAPSLHSPPSLPSSIESQSKQLLAAQNLAL